MLEHGWNVGEIRAGRDHVVLTRRSPSNIRMPVAESVQNDEVQIEVSIAGSERERAYQTDKPPSAMTSWPVMYVDASETRNRTAPLYSSSRAILPRGTRFE